MRASQLMRVLLLHDLMALRPLRRQLSNQCFLFPKYRPDAEVVLHAAGDPVDDALRSGDFDAIFLDVSFLCWRWAKPASVFAQFLSDHAWVADHTAVKVAFPQDDYDHHAVLDEWLAAWKVDLVFSALPNFAEVLYPLTARTGRIQPFLTGFVDDVDLAIAERSHSQIAERHLDIVYRARPLPANFGELGQLKTRVAREVRPAAIAAGFTVDISTDPADTVFGDEWLRFLGSARYVLGTPSGSSVLDARGEVADCIARHAAAHPGAGFEEIMRTCVPPEARYRMEALSPRIFETALVRACQILVRGEYGPLEAGRHYIAIEPDFSNLSEVIAGLADHRRAQRIADACFDLIVNEGRLHYRQAAADIENAVLDCWRRRGDAIRTERLARPPQDVSREEAVERILRAGIADRQRLLDGLARRFADITGDPITISRVGDLGVIVEDRWSRLTRHANEEGASVQAALARLQRTESELAKLRARTASAEARLAEFENASLVRLSRMMAKRVLTRMGLR